jgi:hypothetical protein
MKTLCVDASGVPSLAAGIAGISRVEGVDRIDPDPDRGVATPPLCFGHVTPRVDFDSSDHSSGAREGVCDRARLPGKRASAYCLRCRWMRGRSGRARPQEDIMNRKQKIHGGMAAGHG